MIPALGKGLIISYLSLVFVGVTCGRPRAIKDRPYIRQSRSVLCQLRKNRIISSV